jgi:hypothetical protein
VCYREQRAASKEHKSVSSTFSTSITVSAAQLSGVRLRPLTATAAMAARVNFILRVRERVSKPTHALLELKSKQLDVLLFDTNQEGEYRAFVTNVKVH